MIRKQIAVLFLALSAAAGYAQTVEHLAVASQFNNWQASAQSGPYSNTALIAGANTVSVNPCSVQGDPNHQIPVFAASTPIKIVDLGTPSLTEIVTPSAVSNGGCTATFTTTNAHGSNYIFKSGTAGLQEALNAYALSGGLNTIELDATWFAAGGTYAMVYGAAGNINMAISAINLAPSSNFRWNGSHYLFTTGFNIGTATGAAGAAAGTSPTIATTTSATGSMWTVTLTTGTATTTGTLFTVTFSTAFPTGGANCVVYSTGGNAPPAFTVTATSTTVTTIAVATAPPTATAYTFNGICN